MDLSAYIPQDRRRAIAQGKDLPDRMSGAALFVDVCDSVEISNVILANSRSSERGADELSKQLNRIYNALTLRVDLYEGSIVGFIGDAMMCWFNGDTGLRATACALEMQQIMRMQTKDVAPFVTASGEELTWAIKASVAVGPVRRFVVGDPDIQLLDIMAGATVDRLALAFVKKKGKRDYHEKVVVDEAACRQLGNKVNIIEKRQPAETNQTFAIVEWAGQPRVNIPTGPLSASAITKVTEEQARSWLLKAVLERLASGSDKLLPEIRPAAAVFVGFSGINYDEDEAAPAKLDRYVRWVQATLARQEGYLIEVTMGDKGSNLYIAFGAPRAYDDNDVRAVAGALELLSPPEDMSFIQDIRIGISRGKMRAGAYGGKGRRTTYGVLGQEVSLAARLMGKAKSGQILVSQHVFEATVKHYNFDSLGLVELKGKPKPVSVYRVLGRKYRADGHTEPLLGRETELQKMRGMMDAVLAGQGQILRLVGEPGVGKSHFVSEFALSVEKGGGQVLRSACTDVNQGAPYFAWRPVLSTLFESAAISQAGQEQAGAITPFEQQLRHYNPDWFVRLPVLGDLLGLPLPDNATTARLDPQQRREMLLTLVVELIQTAAHAQPMVLLIEDVHWMDEASQALTLALGRVLAHVPMLLILTQRPPDPGAPWVLTDLDELPGYQSLNLGGLAAEAVMTLVVNRLQGRPSPLVRSLVRAQTRGNPFFIRELIDAMRAAGHLSLQSTGACILEQAVVDELEKANCLVRSNESPEGWDLAPNAPLTNANLGIPNSIGIAVLSRFDHLPEDYKVTLKTASVIGRFFSLDILAQAHPKPPAPDAFREQIQLLIERDFIEPRTSNGSPSSDFLFKHHIIQEVTYSTLPLAQRQTLHYRVGLALERLDLSAVEVIAYHFGQGGDAARDKALRYLDYAAHQAQHDYANETALRYYNQALGWEERWERRRGQIQVLHLLGQREAERAALQTLKSTPQVPASEVHFLTGQYYEATSQYREADEAFENALDAYTEQDDVVNQVRCLTQLGLVAFRRSVYGRANNLYAQAIQLFPGEDECSAEQAAIFAQAHNDLGLVHRQLQDFDQAQVQCEKALELSLRSGDQLVEALARDTLGTIAYHQRKFASAVQYHQVALELRRRIGDRAGEGTSLLNLAQVLSGAGDYGRAEKCLKAALDIHQATGNRWNEVNIWNDLGVLYQELGDWPQAQFHLERGLELARGNGDIEGEIFLLSNLGLVRRDQGDLLNAERVLVEGLEKVRADMPDDKRQISFYLSYLSTVHLQAKQSDLAAEQAKTALTLRRELDLRPRTADDLATLAKAYLELEDINSALDYARQALTILDEGEGPEFPQRDYFFCYQVLWTAGYEDDALKALRSACELVRERAEHIQDEMLRQSFLNNVWINRDIVQACEQHGLQSGTN